MLAIVGPLFLVPGCEVSSIPQENRSANTITSNLVYSIVTCMISSCNGHVELK